MAVLCVMGDRPVLALGDPEALRRAGSALLGAMVYARGGAV